MNKTVLKTVLGRNKWFAGLPPELADGILRLGRVRRLNDALIYSASDCADGMIALISGQIRLTSFSMSGQPSFLVLTSPGSCIVTTSYTSLTIQNVEALERLRASEDPGEV